MHAFMHTHIHNSYAHAHNCPRAGMWFSPEREALQLAIDKTQEFCTGE